MITILILQFVILDEITMQKREKVLQKKQINYIIKTIINEKEGCLEYEQNQEKNI